MLGTEQIAAANSEPLVDVNGVVVTDAEFDSLSSLSALIIAADSGDGWRAATVRWRRKSGEADLVETTWGEGPIGGWRQTCHSSTEEALMFHAEQVALLRAGVDETRPADAPAPRPARRRGKRVA